MLLQLQSLFNALGINCAKTEEMEENSQRNALQINWRFKSEQTRKSHGFGLTRYSETIGPRQDLSYYISSVVVF